MARRLLCVGSGYLWKEGVGKTHLRKKLKGESYDLNLSTDGVQVESLSLSSNKVGKVRLCLFDFGGQEVFYPTHQFFLTDQTVYLLVFNCTEELSNTRLEYWYLHLRLL